MELQEMYRQDDEGRKTVGEEPSARDRGSISVADLSFFYTGSPERSIKVGSLNVSEGEIILLTGKSGSGKSTLVNCINGVIPHIFHGTRSGMVFVSGLDVSRTSLSALSSHIGTLLQDPSTQVLNYTVEEEVAFGPENLCLSRDEIEERVHEGIAITGLGALLGRETFTLSGGEMQRLSLASVLAMRPEVMVLDEPTSNIDPEGTESIFELLKSLAGKKTILIVEHKVERVLPFVDRLVLVDEGEIRLSIAKEDIIDHLDDLVKAGVEIPEHYTLARDLGIRSTELNEVRARIAEEGLVLHAPVRSSAVKKTLEAHSTVHSEQRLLVDASLSLLEGQVFAIMGRNGAGKSTLLNSLCGMLDSRLRAEVTLRVNGQDVGSSSVRDVGSHIAYIPQAFDIVLINSTVEDEIAYSMRRRGKISKKQLRMNIDKFLGLFSLDDLKDRDPLTLSFGQRRRVAMASALASGVSVVMMDEPTSGQDFFHREILGRELSNLKSEGFSFVVVTHDARFVYRHADRMMVMDGGKNVLEGTPEECFRESAKYGVMPPTDFLLRCA